MVNRMEIIAGSVQDSQGEPCLSGKQTCSIIPKETTTRASSILGRVFTDVCGKLPMRSHDSFKYSVTFIDDKSRKVSVQGLKHKSDITCHLQDFISRSETTTGHLLKSLCSNGGGEYTGHALVQWLDNKGIKRELTTPDTPQQNSVAEHMNHTLLDKVHSMLMDAKLPETYWYDALLYTTHLHNVSPTHALKDMMPEEAWSGNKPDVSCRASSDAKPSSTFLTSSVISWDQRALFAPFWEMPQTMLHTASSIGRRTTSLSPMMLYSMRGGTLHDLITLSSKITSQTLDMKL